MAPDNADVSIVDPGTIAFTHVVEAALYQATVQAETQLASVLRNYGLCDIRWSRAICSFNKGALSQYDVVYEIGYGDAPMSDIERIKLADRVSQVFRNERMYGHLSIDCLPGVEYPITAVFSFRFNCEDVEVNRRTSSRN